MYRYIYIYISETELLDDTILLFGACSLNMIILRVSSTHLFIYLFFTHYFRRKEWCPKKIVLIIYYKVRKCNFVVRHKLPLLKSFTSRMQLKILVCLKYYVFLVTGTVRLFRCFYSFHCRKICEIVRKS